MYLNLDLLYNTFSFLDTVYYIDTRFIGGRIIYSPLTRKAIQYGLNYNVYFDFYTEMCYLNCEQYLRISEYGTPCFEKEKCVFSNSDALKFIRCDPFTIGFLDTYYLNNNSKLQFNLI